MQYETELRIWSIKHIASVVGLAALTSCGDSADLAPRDDEATTPASTPQSDALTRAQRLARRGARWPGSAGAGNSAVAGNGAVAGSGDSAGAGAIAGGGYSQVAGTGAVAEGGRTSGSGGASGDGTPAPDPGGNPPISRVSLEVGRTEWGSDYLVRRDVPAGGTLFSIWTKIPDPGSSYPWSRGNMDAYVLRGSNWYFRCLVGNSGARSPADARYNANTMLFANSAPSDTWVGDYSYYESDFGHAEAPYRDWVWVAWQIVVDADSFTIRQWLKLGREGNVFAAGESDLSFGEARSILISKGWSESAARAWNPADATEFQIGSDHGFLTHARMAAQGTTPTLSELDEIALRSVAKSSSWAEYPLLWESGGAYLRDQSGHGRDLSLATGGTVYAGAIGPAF